MESVKLKFLLNRVEEISSSLLYAVVTIIIGAQVFSRYVLGDSLTWSEELGRYLFIWAIYLACGYAVQQNRHFEITFFKNMFGSKVEKFISIISYLITIIFCIIIVIYGISMSMFIKGTGQVSPAIGLPMYLVYLAIPVGMGIMGLRTIQKLYNLLTNQE